MSLVEATEASIAAAKHLTKADDGAVAAILHLALKIDLMDEYLEALADDAAKHNRRPPSPDNVSVPTYLKYCESLGLTPAGRLRLGPSEEKPGGKLGQLRSVAKGA